MTDDIAIGPDGLPVELVGIGTSEILDTEHVRVWDVSLPPGTVHSWHLHRNPYAVLSVTGGQGRMEWLDGREPRLITEYAGGAVFRPTSPIHRLVNLSDHTYRNRLIELKALGESRADGVFDVGEGDRSREDDVAPPPLPDGRVGVLAAHFVAIHRIDVPAGMTVRLDLAPHPHVLVRLDPHLDGDDLAGSVCEVPGGITPISAKRVDERWFIVSLDYLDHRTDLEDFAAQRRKDVLP